jgi:hypothetical protein
MPVCQNPQTVLRNLPKPIADLSLHGCEKTYPSATLLFESLRHAAEKAVVPYRFCQVFIWGQNLVVHPAGCRVNAVVLAPSFLIEEN